MNLLYLEKVPAAIRGAFGAKVTGIAEALGISPDWLMQVMYAESRLSPTAANRQGNPKHLVAAGLLQFTAGSGIVSAGKVAALESILTMSAMQQLDLVEWYFSRFKGRMRSYYDVYAVCFFPGIIGKPDDWIVQSRKLSPAIIARQNPAIAKGKSFITVADFRRYTNAIVPETVRDRIFGIAEIIQKETGEIKEAAIEHPKESAGIATGILLLLFLLGLSYLKH